MKRIIKKIVIGNIIFSNIIYGKETTGFMFPYLEKKFKTVDKLLTFQEIGEYYYKIYGYIKSGEEKILKWYFNIKEVFTVTKEYLDKYGIIGLITIGLILLILILVLIKIKNNLKGTIKNKTDENEKLKIEFKELEKEKTELEIQLDNELFKNKLEFTLRIEDINEKLFRLKELSTQKGQSLDRLKIIYFNIGYYSQDIKEKNFYYGRVLDLDPKYPRANFHKGQIEFILGEMDSAINHFNNSIMQEPMEKIGYLFRGMAYVEKKEYNLGILDYTKAIEIDRDYIEAYGKRAEALKLKGDFQEALKDTQMEIELSPEKFQGYMRRGDLNFKLKNYQNSVLDYTEAVEIFPNSAEAYSKRSIAKLMVSSSRNSMLEALQDMNKSLEINPNSLKTQEYRKRVIELLEENKTEEKKNEENINN